MEEGALMTPKIILLNVIVQIQVTRAINVKKRSILVRISLAKTDNVKIYPMDNLDVIVT